MCVGQAATIGKLLIEAKGLLPHGEFEVWYEKNTPYSYSRCREFMQYAKLTESRQFDSSSPVYKLIGSTSQNSFALGVSNVQPIAAS